MVALGTTIELVVITLFVATVGLLGVILAALVGV